MAGRKGVGDQREQKSEERYKAGQGEQESPGGVRWEEGVGVASLCSL